MCAVAFYRAIPSATQQLPPSRDDATPCEPRITHHVVVDSSIGAVELRHQEVQEEDLEPKRGKVRLKTHRETPCVVYINVILYLLYTIFYSISYYINLTLHFN